MHSRTLVAALALLTAVPASAVKFCSEPGASIVIPDNDPAGASDSLVIQHGESIADLDLLLEIPHTWVGDLLVTLEHEETGTAVTVVDRPGVAPGCSGNDLNLRLDDDATTTAEDDCMSGDNPQPAYLLGGIYRPGDPAGNVLQAFAGQALAGTWTLAVSDNADQDEGTIDRWCLIAPTTLEAIGAEFQVNTSTALAQSNPAVAIAASGDFMVAWTSDDSGGSDSSASSVQGQRYGSDGSTLGSEFQINTYTTSAQYNSTLAMAADGAFVVVWNSPESGGSDVSGYSILGQRFGSDGSPAGGEFQVNTYTTSHQYNPAVAQAPDGDFVVVWNSDGSAGSDSLGYSIQGQRYGSDGSPAGGQFQVNTYSTERQFLPAVAMAPNGDFIVAWMSNGSGGSDSDSPSIQGQRFGSDGSPTGGELQVNTYTTSGQHSPAVAMAADGDAMVIWESQGSAGSDSTSLSFSVQGQRYGSDGSPAGGEFQVNTYTTGNQEQAAVAMEAGGEFVVTWRSLGSGGSDSDSFSIQGQRFASDGSPVAGEFQVNTYATSFQRNPAVAMAAGGDTVVIWESLGSGGSDSDGLSVQGQRFGDPQLLFADGFESGNTSAW